MADDILKYFERQISEVVLEPSFGGRFEVTIGDSLVFSKLAEKRHAAAGEVIRKITDYFEKGS
ncbi:MAG TPA: Rdx family protein [Bellilinea sp.]|nr:Rdx family protein [Bellilinea sp.]